MGNHVRGGIRRERRRITVISSALNDSRKHMMVMRVKHSYVEMVRDPGTMKE